MPKGQGCTSPAPTGITNRNSGWRVAGNGCVVGTSCAVDYSMLICVHTCTCQAGILLVYVALSLGLCEGKGAGKHTCSFPHIPWSCPRATAGSNAACLFQTTVKRPPCRQTVKRYRSVGGGGGGAEVGCTSESLFTPQRTIIVYQGGASCTDKLSEGRILLRGGGSLVLSGELCEHAVAMGNIKLGPMPAPYYGPGAGLVLSSSFGGVARSQDQRLHCCQSVHLFLCGEVTTISLSTHRRKNYHITHNPKHNILLSPTATPHCPTSRAKTSVLSQRLHRKHLSKRHLPKPLLDFWYHSFFIFNKKTITLFSKPFLPFSKPFIFFSSEKIALSFKTIVYFSKVLRYFVNKHYLFCQNHFFLLPNFFCATRTNAVLGKIFVELKRITPSTTKPLILGKFRTTARRT